MSEPSATRLGAHWKMWVPGADHRRIAAAIGGDRRAFDELVDSNRQELGAFLKRRLVDEEVEDLVQETLIAAWGSLSNFDRRSSFRTWLFSIALNKCRDHYRSRAVQSQRNRSSDPDEAEGTYHEQGYQATELGEAIRGVLGDLPETHREVLSLYYFDGLNLPEVAAALNRNLNTVKYQFYRAHDEAARRLEPILGMKAAISSTSEEARR